MDYNKVIYKSGSKTLTIAGNNVSFIDDSGSSKNILEEDAKRVADSLMKNIGIKTTGNYELDGFSKSESSYSFEYFLKFKKFKIFSSKAEVEVSALGIKSFSVSFFNIDNQLEKKQDICSCDEALLTFMYEIKKKNIEENIFINNIELGYDFQNTGEIAEGRSLKLVPCYYIYVANEESPYIIDAYKNEIKLG
ncbi:hypothetical protein SDC9_177254 [bioreactor metagenome]|uniref:Uncharacterized protein n=1 Tax=bioreactor metagenome TaxID=1076179 RepID=A0A645GSH1_9ZZZZ